MAALLTVAQAITAIRGALSPLRAEEVSLETAHGRILAAPVLATLSQPPFNSSAMDGYAVRFEDVREAGALLEIAGVSSPGKGFWRSLPSAAAVRIFTGAPVPDGADHILIQEEAESVGGKVIVRAPQQSAQYVRRLGMDFRKGDALLSDGARLTGAALALAAAGNAARVTVRKRPRVAIIANGDELVLPGVTPSLDQIICSIPFGLAPLIEGWGAEAVFLGVAPDDKPSLHRMAGDAADFDLVAPIGGASVGEHDFMRAVFAELGFAIKFEKVAVRPGKPTWFGVRDHACVLGLPGNPASAFVAATLFLKPAIERLLGMPADCDRKFLLARSAARIAETGPRETYLRAHVTEGADGVRCIAPFDLQDSSLLSIMTQSNALLRRESGAPAASAGELVEFLPL